MKQQCNGLVKLAIAVILLGLSSLGQSAIAHNNVVVIPLTGDDIPTPDPKIVFASAEQNGFNLGGYNGADDICQAEANTNPSLSGKTFKAWLNGSTTSTYEPDFATAERFLRLPEGQLVSPSGQVFNDHWTHILKFGSDLQDVEIASCNSSSGNYTDCLTDFNNFITSETVMGLPIIRRDTYPLGALVNPKWEYTDSSYSCDSFSSDSRLNEAPRIFQYVVDPNALDNPVAFNFIDTTTSCDSSFRFYCLEQ